MGYRDFRLCEGKSGVAIQFDRTNTKVGATQIHGQVDALPYDLSTQTDEVDDSHSGPFLYHWVLQ